GGLRGDVPAECGVGPARSEEPWQADEILEVAFVDLRAVAIEAVATADTGEEGLAGIEEAGAFAEVEGFTEGAATGRSSVSPDKEEAPPKKKPFLTQPPFAMLP
ncbi:MAG: hypothetical protein PHP75_06865, partial [Methylacidiphilaceae bacterium]|nr:hypothetical protein [Candidatus Methylacidiphilaceae bacterium]